MDQFFLSAGQPICKAYSLNSKKKLVKTPYPFVYEVTSHLEQSATLQELCTHIQAHSAQGHTLVKGNLARPLVSESRANSTDAKEKTSWICLDLDGIENYADVDSFLKDIGCQNTDYILQWSSSMGVENQIGLRCHVFMLLDKPMHPQTLKYWLMNLNLSTTNIASQIQLTKTGMALRWPLDITTCQNDKLIYIASPVFGAGLTDPYATTPRISLVIKKHRELRIAQTIPTKEILKEKLQTKILELRSQAGLPDRKKLKYKYHGSMEVLQDPDEASITEMKEERGYVYFNLNGGDSWAYYHPNDNCKYIHNFKGEPTYLTKDLLPEYWAELNAKTSSCTPDHRGNILLAFRDFRTANYYNGTYNTGAGTLKLAQAKSETQLRHFMEQNGKPMGEFVPDWQLSFDPTTSVIVDPINQTVNVYQPSVYMAAPQPKKAPQSIPPVIGKVINHALGNNQACTDHFINWLACIVQYPGATGTAWVLHGTQGTGKGVLFHQILTPLFGDTNTVAKRMEELDSEFTGFMENKFIAFIDEVEQGASMYHSKVTAKLKNLIVEPTISIRHMYTPAYMSKNFTNMIFASNKPEPVRVEKDDRRFNVGDFQPIKIQITSQEIDRIPAELQTFADYLRAYPADQSLARSPLITAARAQLIELGRSSIDTLSDALNTGDLKFLWDMLPAQKPGDSGMNIGLLAYERYRDLMIKIVTTGENKLTREDLAVIFEWCTDHTPQSPNKFTSMLKHHNVNICPLKLGSRTVRGIQVSWQSDPAWLLEAQNEISQNLV